MNSLEQRDLKKELWGVLNAYRRNGRMLDRDVVVHAAALLFLRWADFHEAEQRAIAEFDRSHYPSALPDHLRWSALRQRDFHDLMRFFQRELVPSLKWADSTPLGQQLHRIGVALEQTGIEQSESLSSLEPIFELFRWIDSLPFDFTADRAAAGNVLEVLISDFTGGKDSGQFMTPQPIVDLMIELADPKPGDRIYDPCFGMGGLLVASTRRLQEQATVLSPGSWLAIQETSIFGVEINPIAYAIGLTRVVLAGIDQPRLELGDTLERSLLQNRASEGFDRILAVPPWGQRSSAYAHRNEFPIPTSTTEALFLQHIMASLRPGGRAVVAFPDGIFFRSGAEKYLRERLVSDFYVEGVLALPPGAFAPFTGLNSNLLIFRREEPASSIRFFLVENFPSGQRKREFASPDEQRLFVKRVAQTFHDGKPGTHLWNTPITTLAQRDWELIVKRTGDDALAEQLNTLIETDPTIKLRSLQQVAEVFTGISYKQEMITKDPKHPDVVKGLLRVSDVKDVGAKAPELFLTKAGESKVKKKHYLRPLDIIVTKSGTIGKVGLISDVAGTVGAIATQGLAVIRPKEGVTAQFLAELLRSPAYQSWLKGHARGATIQHLSMEALKDLKIPVAPLQMQDRLWQGTHGRISDALSALVRMATGASDDPVLTWLEQSKVVRSIAETEKAGSEARLLWCDRFGKELSNLRNREVHGLETVPAEILPWLIASATAASALTGIHEIPDGTGRLAVLENAHRRMRDALEELDNNSIAVIERARQVSYEVIKLVTREIESTLENTGIEINPEPASVEVGTPSEVNLLIHNVSPTSLRNLSFQTVPTIGTGKITYLSESEKGKIPLLVKPQQTSGTFDFTVIWRAQRLDGNMVQGEIPLSLAIRSLRESSVANLGASPYVVGRPIEREEMFYGRDDVIEQIKDHLNDETQSNVILLEGNRRTGKTSILRQLQKDNNLHSWLMVECSLQGADSMATRHVFRLFTRTIWEACTTAGVVTWLPSQPPPASDRPLVRELVDALDATFSGDHPFEAFELYLRSVLEAIQPCKLLLMLDEFDKLQEGIDQGITNPQVPENIRYLLHTYSDMSAIITGSRRLKRLREEYWSALFGFGYQIGISALPLDSARNLVTEPVEGQLLFLPEARDRLVNLCACQPYLIQSLCTRVFERSKRQAERTITPALVESAATAMVEDNEHFRTLWKYAGTERRRMILAICQRFVDGDDPTNLDFLETKLEEFGIRVPKKRGLGEDLDFLRELELIDFDSTQGREAYALSIPLMEKWIQRHIDFEDLKREAMREAEEVL
ncbi:N-6 DNA methylase [Trichocoleus sp. FACHB-591]|uniref:N-6 DNA methylase n=1 Tax=Trichocoleus sp. FACHB-591 TaxID=2692872 RepID=UPI00168392BB|nr:N-6 DNA methylase [Trichocoleus sp. FACHB-591]MBD2094261.1 N-6 DNA methylase [Trichocoleus sp. FACHB-591]